MTPKGPLRGPLGPRNGPNRVFGVHRAPLGLTRVLKGCSVRANAFHHTPSGSKTIPCGPCRGSQEPPMVIVGATSSILNGRDAPVVTKCAHRRNAAAFRRTPLGFVGRVNAATGLLKSLLRQLEPIVCPQGFPKAP